MEIEARGTILIVDDEPDVVQMYKDLLDPIAQKIFTASNGLEALNVIQSVTIDAILTDIKMPVMSGLEFLEEVRKLRLQTPVVVVTAYGDKKSVIEALRLNATDFLEKPVELINIKEIMGKALRLGLMLNDLERGIEAAFANTTLPKDEVEKIKRVKKMMAGMKAASAVYLKKVD